MPLITYQAEPWSRALPEMMGLWPGHWAELASDQDKIGLDPDLDRYSELERRGTVHVITARMGGELVGYYIWLVSKLLHHRTVLAAQADNYWLRPDCRKGFAGVRLFMESERYLKALGVKQMFSGTRCAHDKGLLFERLGWTQTERTYCKYIGSE